MPISAVEPKRFLVVRRMRYAAVAAAASLLVYRSLAYARYENA